MSRKQSNQQLNQAGFSAVEAVLILVIVALVAGIGYYVYHVKQTSDNTLTAAQKSATVPPAAKPGSVISLDKTKVPTGWKVANDTAYSVMLNGPDSGTVMVTQTAQSSLKSSGADSFVSAKVATIGKTTVGGVATTVGSPVELSINSNGTQTVTAYPEVNEDSKGQVTTYGKVAYVVGNGYYVTITESATAQSQLTQADQALQAIAIKQ